MDDNGNTATATLPQTASQFIEETFLSPRVVDGALLREFADSLRVLLSHAAAQRDLLRAAVTEGRSVADTLNDTASKAGEKLRPVVKLIPTIDQKLAQAEEALTRANDAAAGAERAAGEAAKAAAEEGAVALRQAQEAFDAALARAREIEARLGQFTDRAEQAVDTLDRECKARLDTAARHAQDVLGTMVAELDARAEEAMGRLTVLLDQRRAAAEAAMGEVIAIGEQLGGPIAHEPPAPEPTPPAPDRTATLEAATAAAAEACADIETLIESIKSRANSMEEGLDIRASRTATKAEEATRRAERAQRLAEIAEARLEAAEAQLRMIDERGREIAANASHALAAFDEQLGARMHTVREMMEQLASLTAGPAPAAPCPSPATEPSHPTPVETAEIKPGAGRLLRIDRPADAGAGLPGRLKF
jgi:DNA repair exonuclease SbcCD ATPase subunit